MLELQHNPLLHKTSAIEPASHSREVKKRRFARLRRQARAVEQIGELPAAGEDLVMIMTGSFHGWDLVGAIAELAGCPIAALHVATLGFNRTQTLHLCELLDTGQIGALTMVVSEMFREKNAREFKGLAEAMAEREQIVAANRNHAKLMLFDMADGRKFVTHGSLNLRRCNSYEQVVISQDEGLFKFFRKFITAMAR